MQQFVAFEMARRGTIFDILDSLHRNSNVGEAGAVSSKLRKKNRANIALQPEIFI